MVFFYCFAFRIFDHGATGQCTHVVLDEGRHTAVQRYCLSLRDVRRIAGYAGVLIEKHAHLQRLHVVAHVTAVGHLGAGGGGGRRAGGRGGRRPAGRRRGGGGGG